MERGFQCGWSCAVSPLSLSVSTLTPLEDPTLRMSLPSSANSRLSSSSSFGSPVSCSGLSPSSTGLPAKSGFRKAFRKASAMMAASAPENGPGSPALLALDIVEAPSGDTTLGAPCPCEVAVLACRPGTTAPARSGDACEWPAFAIIGELEPIELRLDSIAFRRRTRRMMKNVSTHVVTIARNPRTTMTAMAQCGKLELLADCTLLLFVGPAPPASVRVERRDSEDPVVCDVERAAAVADPAAAVEAMEAMTESANVVWTAENVACGF